MQSRIASRFKKVKAIRILIQYLWAELMLVLVLMDGLVDDSCWTSLSLKKPFKTKIENEKNQAPPKKGEANLCNYFVSIP